MTVCCSGSFIRFVFFNIRVVVDIGGKRVYEPLNGRWSSWPTEICSSRGTRVLKHPVFVIALTVSTLERGIQQFWIAVKIGWGCHLTSAQPDGRIFIN